MTEESNSIDNIKLCECGCGSRTEIYRGKPRSFLYGHNLLNRNQLAENNPNWKGGKPKQDKDGYWLIYKPEHPNHNAENRVFQHRLIYEHYLSIILDEEVYLNRDEEIHHINKNKEDNCLINLQYMKTKKEHKQEHLIDYIGVKCKKCATSETTKRKDNGRPRWVPDRNGEGFFCESCDKKRYYLENKEKRQKYKEKNYDKILQQQILYNKTKRKGRGVNK